MAAAPRLSLGKKVLFSIAVTVAFFALLEGVLALAGVKPRLFADDPYVGFSSTTPLFVPVTSDDGTRWMTTSPAKLTLFNEQRFRADKPDGVTRIFCVGGSTTFGRPYDDATSFCGWIRAFLDEADPGSFEVVNAGGVSYASYRVALLMEELANYEPDLFVVYSGHNEFLEERTYRDLIEMPEALRGLGGLAARTRIHTAVTGLLNPSAPTETDQGTTTVLAAEVTTRLDDSIGPDAYERDPELQEAILAHYRYNLARMVDIARAAGAEAVLAVPASNLADCAPFKGQHGAEIDAGTRQAWSDAVRRTREALSDEDIDAALAASAEAVALDPVQAEGLFLRGRALLADGRVDEARSAFEQARDEDVCPLRFLGAMDPIVRQVAADRDAPLADVAQRVDAASEAGIPGRSLFLDHVHPTIQGNRLVAETFLDTLVERGLLKLPADWSPERADAVAQRITEAVDPEEHALALMKLSKVLGWAGKLGEADDLAQRAVALFPDDARVRHQAGLTAHLLGRTRQAAGHYLAAVTIQPDADEPHLNLGVILKEAGDLVAAERHLRAGLASARTPSTAAMCRSNLAETLVGLGFNDYSDGQFAAAVDRFTEADALAPGNGDTLSRLGIALQAAGRLQDAVTTLDRAVAAEPDNPFTWNQLAVARALVDDVAGAREAWHRAVALDRRIIQSPQAAPLLLHASGRTPAARALMEGMQPG
jgi:Flp pilus assembly protein TadD